MNTVARPAMLAPLRFIPITADALNRGCSCRSLNPQQLRRELEKEPSLAGLADNIEETRPNLFSAMAVFISQAQYARMAAIVAAVERVIALPAYRDAALARAPAIAQLDFGPRGAFTGFDFHLAPRGPKLIEVNTNAGGGLLNTALTRAQQACCGELLETAFKPSADIASMEHRFIAMFREEWQLQRAAAPLTRVAIVDDDPATQYLHPEFLLCQELFARAGIDAVVADARLLEWHDQRLWYQGRALDMVYNRLTDFYLEDPSHAALRSAFDSGAVVVTPSPRAHALYADKRNLVNLSDDAALTALGVSAETRTVLADGVPHTELVSADKAGELWTGRRTLFFKPATGYGGKATYRGDKLTRRVWQEILAGNYVAQELVPPSERLVDVDGVDTELKLDIRAYAYAGKIQLLAARLYQGQTTNFRTRGGGFAPVFLVNPASERPITSNAMLG